MPTYITLGNWTDQGVRTVKDAAKRIDAAKQMMKEAGGGGLGNVRTTTLRAFSEAESRKIFASIG